MEPEVSIIVLNWNGGITTLACIESLKKINYPNYNILIVDNASTDGLIEKIPRRNGIKIIRNALNLGFAEGMNVGIRAVQPCQGGESEYVLVLNQDTVVHPDFLQELIRVAESDSRIGIVGPKTYYYHTNTGAREIIYSCGTKYPTGKVFKIRIPYIVPELIGFGEEERHQYDTVFEVPALCGCCMLIKREVIQKVGLFDSRLFMVREDDDYCIRARKSGYKICVAPKSIIWHRKIIDKNQDKQNSNEPFGTYYRIRNWLLVTRKYFGVKVFIKILFAHSIKLALLPVLIWMKNTNLSFRSIPGYFWAYIDALTQRTPKRFLT